MTDNQIIYEIFVRGIGWEDAYYEYNCHGLTKAKARRLTWEAHRKSAQSVKVRWREAGQTTKTASTTR